MASQKPTLTLEAVPAGEYERFADGLREFHPHSYQIEGMLRTHCIYQHLSNVHATLYAPTAAHLRFKMAIITPVCALRTVRGISLFWSDKHISEDDAFQLLSSLPFDSWLISSCTVRQMPLHLQPSMHKILMKLSGGLLSRMYPMPTVALALAPEDTPPIPELPEGYYYKRLDGSYADHVLSRWIPRYTETRESMTFHLETLPNVGIFYKNKPVAHAVPHKPPLTDMATQNTQNLRMEGQNVTNESGTPEIRHQSRDEVSNADQRDELVSFVVLKPGSDVGMTFTEEKHRRKGLGQASTIYIAHELHSKGILVTVNVLDDLEVSITMHKKMGFKYLAATSFPFYRSKTFELQSVPFLQRFFDGQSITEDRWEDISHMK